MKEFTLSKDDLNSFANNPEIQRMVRITVLHYLRQHKASYSFLNEQSRALDKHLQFVITEEIKLSQGPEDIEHLIMLNLLNLEAFPASLIDAKVEDRKQIAQLYATNNQYKEALEQIQLAQNDIEAAQKGDKQHKGKKEETTK